MIKHFMENHIHKQTQARLKLKLYLMLFPNSLKRFPKSLLIDAFAFYVPVNEFSEHCTGDMTSMDTAYHYMLNFNKSQFPKAAFKQLVFMQNRYGVSKNV